MQEIGMSLIFNGKENIYMSGEVKKYPIGAIACEYARLLPKDVKDVIDLYKENDSKFNKENIVKVLDNLKENLLNRFGLISGIMILTEIFNSSHWLLNSNEEIVEELLNEYNSNPDDSIRDYILKGSGEDIFKIDTVYNALLFLYYCFAQSYILFKTSFFKTTKKILNNSLIEEDYLDHFLSFYGSEYMYQDIDYKILVIDGKFESIYTVKNSFSLLLFEMAHIIDKGVPIKKCKNCGQYFVPSNRSDEEYCEYIYDEKTKKTCKDVGAKIARVNKEKNDEFTYEYRKLYMRLQMKYRRSPSKVYIKENLDKLVEEAKHMRKEINKGNINENEWRNWLLSFEE